MTQLIQLISKIKKKLTTVKIQFYNNNMFIFIHINYRMIRNLLINKNKILTNCYNTILYVHETSEYYHYIHLYNF